MLTKDLTYDQLDAVISRFAGRTLTADEAFRLCEAQGFCAVTTEPNGFVCEYEGGQVVADSPVMAIKRAFVRKHFGDSVEV